MVTRFDTGKVRLTVDEKGAKPAVLYNPQGHVILHLTKGFNPSSFPENQGNAIAGDARFTIEGGLGSTDFGFIQVGRVNVFSVIYAGRTPGEGSVTALAHSPPALTTPVLLDAIGKPPLPWFEDPGAVSSAQGQILTSKWGDHPGAKVQTEMENGKLSRTPNYLFRLIDDREFWTVLAVQDPGTPVRHLMHFHWQVRHDLQFQWRNGAPSPVLNNSFVKVHTRQAPGLPTEPAVQAILANPREPRANVVFMVALRLALRGAAGSNRTESAERAANVPPTFWA